MGDTGYAWHPNPDGGAVFAQDDGGWIYVSNSESPLPDGGASMVRFDADGQIVEAHRILEGSVGTAPAGPPRGARGCPARRSRPALSTSATRPAPRPPSKRPAMGLFQHEAAAADPGAR